MSQPNEFMELEERIRRTRPSIGAVSPAFEQSLRQHLLGEAMKKNRLLGMNVATLAWGGVAATIVVIMIGLFWNVMSSRSSTEPVSSPSQEVNDLFTPSNELVDEAEMEGENGGIDETQSDPAGGSDIDGTVPEESSEELDPGEAMIDDTPVPAAMDGFALYLTAGEFFLDQLPELDEIELAEEPLLSAADMLWYDPETHIVELTESAAGRLTQLELPGRPFVATVDGRPLYHGGFMAAYMSRSYDGVVILWPSMLGEERQLQIQLGYPGSDFFAGEDPRADAVIMEALSRDGKLKPSE